MPLSVVEFGRRLVQTGDLDPVYTMLCKAQLPPEVLRRWLLAYWCFYHCGTASWIVSQADYWNAMEEAAADSVHPRGTERRHFRGKLSIESVEYLKNNDTVEGLFDFVCTPRLAPSPIPLRIVMERVQTLVGFGPWIAFKVADMLDRLSLTRIEFSEADTFLFDAPRKGAELVVEHYYFKNGQLSFPLVTTEAKWAFNYLDQHLGGLDAPPRFERKLNGQEYETILCKWKSHLGGHYEVGHDITEIRHGLLRYARCRLAQRLIKCLP